MGVYYLTVMEEPGERRKRLPTFSDMDEAEYAYDMGVVGLRQPIRVRFATGLTASRSTRCWPSSEGNGDEPDAGISERVLEALDRARHQRPLAR